MWKSHYAMDTTIGHYDMWHHIYSDHSSVDHDTDNSNNTINTRQTPCVSLLRKKGHLIHPSPHYLHNRPFSPFSSYYEESDIYLGCEYDIFGSEPRFISSTTTATTTIHNNSTSDHTTFRSSSSSSSSSSSNDPFLIPSQINNCHQDTSLSVTSSSLASITSNQHHQQQQQQLKRSRNDHDIDQVTSSIHNDKRQRINGIIPMDDINQVSSISSINQSLFDSFGSSTNQSKMFLNDNQLEYC